MKAPRPGPHAIDPRQRAARRELARRARLPAAVDAMLAGLFGPQRALALSAARRIVTCAGRRSGKTHALVARAVRAAERNPGGTIPVFQRTLTCASSRAFWKALQDVNDEFRLECRFHNSLFLASLPNGSEIILLGADTADAADKARGGYYPEALIDEAGTYRAHILRYLLEDVLTAALFDQHGTCVMAGTPSVRAAGPFAEACANSRLKPEVADTWEQHHWTLFENPYLPKDAASADLSDEVRAELRRTRFEEEMSSRGHTLDSPYVRREYLGQWVHDDSHLAYRIAPHNYAGVMAPPDLYTHPQRYRWALGIDMGFNDPCAFVVVAQSRDRNDPTLWVVESYEQTGLIPSAVAAHAARLKERWPITSIVVDTGGYGKGPAAEMASKRWGLQIIAAKKSPGYKETARAFFNGDLQAGRIKYVETANADLIHDTSVLRVNPDDGTEDRRDANHLPDALLYVAMHLARSDDGLGAERSGRVVMPGSEEWAAAQEAAMLAAAKQRAQPPRLDPALAGLPE